MPRLSDLKVKLVPKVDKPFEGPTLLEAFEETRRQKRLRAEREEQRLRDRIATYERKLAVLNARYPEPPPPPRVISRGEAAYYNHHLAPDPYPHSVVLPEGGTLLERLAEHARRYAEGDYGAQP